MSTDRLSELFSIQRAQQLCLDAQVKPLLDQGNYKQAHTLISNHLTRMANQPGPVETYYAEQAAARIARGPVAPARRAASVSMPRIGAPTITLANVAAVGIVAGAGLYLASLFTKDQPSGWASKVASERTNGAGQSHVR